MIENNIEKTLKSDNVQMKFRSILILVTMPLTPLPAQVPE